MADLSDAARQSSWSDEATPALDVSVQATILALVSDLSTQFATAVIFVSHDLAVVRSIADRIAVMQHGQIRETATTRTLFANPRVPTPENCSPRRRH